MARTSHADLAAFLTNDVEWIEWADGVPASGARKHGQPAFIQNFGDDELRATPTRITEENNVVVVEGTIHVRKKDGTLFTVQSCNIFELVNGKIKRLSSFGALVKNPE